MTTNHNAPITVSITGTTKHQFLVYRPSINMTNKPTSLLNITHNIAIAEKKLTRQHQSRSTILWRHCAHHWSRDRCNVVLLRDVRTRTFWRPRKSGIAVHRFCVRARLRVHRNQSTSIRVCVRTCLWMARMCIQVQIGGEGLDIALLVKWRQTKKQIPVT